MIPIVKVSGSWHEMGRAIGEQLEEKVGSVIDLLCPWVRSAQGGPDEDRVKSLIQAYESHLPEFIEETQGMAEVMKLSFERLFAYRCFGEWSVPPREECSLVVLKNPSGGLFLGRTCDNPGDDNKYNQAVLVREPVDGTRTAHIGYAGMFSMICMNERGVAAVGSSAIMNGEPSPSGLPASLLGNWLSQKATRVTQIKEFISSQKFRGYPMNVLIADGEDGILRLECHGGGFDAFEHEASTVCTNFFPSVKTPPTPVLRHMENAYARYGRLKHRLELGVEADLEGMHELLGDVVQSRLVCDGKHVDFETYYLTIADLQSKTFHFRALPLEAGELESVLL